MQLVSISEALFIFNTLYRISWDYHFGHVICFVWYHVISCYILLYLVVPCGIMVCHVSVASFVSSFASSV